MMMTLTAWWRGGVARRLGACLVLVALWDGPAQAALQCRPLALAPASRPLPGRFDRGLLFRIEAPGARSSHIYGTIHVGDQRVLDAVRQAYGPFEGSRHFVMESVLDESGMRAFSKLSVYEDETRLREVLGPDLYQATAALLAGHGIPAEALNRMRPWAAYMTLNMPPPTGSLPLDLVLMERARGRGMGVHGLESVEEQAQALGQLALEDQRGLLQDAVCQYHRLQDELEQMTALYLQRDLGGLMALAARYQDIAGGRYKRLFEGLLVQRNRRMVERMEQYLSAGEAFIAIGALHLAGEHGVLAQLEAKGYRLTVVY